jgi:hypothetical protein
MPTADIKRVFDTITAKRRTYSDNFNYYDGDQPVMYSTQAMREVFRNLDARFTLNFCAVVIDAVKERIAFKGYTVKDQTANTALSDLLTDQDLLNEADETHEAALVCGEAFVIVWPQLDGTGQETGRAEIFYNDPRNVAVFYDPANPKQAAFAGKMWSDDTQYHHMTIYYPDHLEYYVTQKASETSGGSDISEKSFTPDLSRAGVVVNGSEITWPLNPYAPDLPVFHFQLEKRIVKSDIKNVIPLQNGMNKLMADMMITSEFAAWPQRYIISQADTTALQVKPGTILNIPAGLQGEQASSAGEFQAAPLSNYLDGVDKLIGYTSSITNTPKHYFDPSGDAPSGEALIAMEAPLNKKAQDRIDKFSPVWQRIAAFALRIQGMTVNPRDITVNFAAPETVQPKTQADIIKTNVDSTIPLETALKKAGWSDTEIEAMKKVRDEEKSSSQTSLANALLQAQQNVKNQPMPPMNGVNANVNA